jgi:hypothetical protein
MAFTPGVCGKVNRSGLGDVTDRILGLHGWAVLAGMYPTPALGACSMPCDTAARAFTAGQSPGVTRVGMLRG